MENTTQREILYANLFLGIILLVGTGGYMLIEGWSWDDSFYMTFITLTTIGFGEIHEMSSVGRFFTIFIALLGIGSVTFIATRMAQMLIASKRLRMRHNHRMIQRLKNHYILCGYGRIGRRIIHDLVRAEIPFVVIELESSRIEGIAKDHLLYVHGNAEEEAVLLAAGIERAQGLILTLPEDSTSVFVTLTARELNPDLFILVRTDNHHNRQKLMRAGANKVIAPYEIGADRMAQVIVRPHVDRFMEQVLQTGALDLRMEEVVVEKNAPLDGQTLAESQFRQRFDAIVVAILNKRTEKMKFNPSAHARIEAGDVLIVLGNPEMINLVRSRGCSS